MPEGDADKRAERPEHQPRIGGGTAEGKLGGHQAGAAWDESVSELRVATMEEVVRRDNMLRAYHRVKRNQGAAGVDGMSVEALPAVLQERWEAIREALLNGAYEPQAVRGVEIPKPGGNGVRVLGIPTVIDRLIQQALLQVLQPVFEPTFSDSSFGFRPGRSAHQALERAREHLASGRRWVVDMDLEKFFDRVNHDVLMSRLARRIEDKRILKLIRRYLEAGMMREGVVSQRSQGTPSNVVATASPVTPMTAIFMCNPSELASACWPRLSSS